MPFENFSGGQMPTIFTLSRTLPTFCLRRAMPVLFSKRQNWRMAEHKVGGREFRNFQRFFRLFPSYPMCVSANHCSLKCYEVLQIERSATFQNREFAGSSCETHRRNAQADVLYRVFPLRKSLRNTFIFSHKRA